MSTTRRPDPGEFLAPGGVFVPALVARAVLDELLPPLAQLAARNLSPTALGVLQAFADAEARAAAPDPTPPAGPWVSVREAAAAVGCTPRYVLQLVHAGDVDARRYEHGPWSVDLGSLHARLSRARPTSRVGSATTSHERLVAGEADQRRTA